MPAQGPPNLPPSMDGTVDENEVAVVERAGAMEMAPTTSLTRREARDFEKEDREWPFKIRIAAFRIIRWGMYSIAASMIAILIIVLVHLLAPSSCKWLKPDEVHTLSDILALVSTGAVGAFLGKYFRKIFSDVEN